MCLNTGAKLPLTRAPSLALSPSEPDFLPLSKLPCRPDLRKAPAKRRRMTPDVTRCDLEWEDAGAKSRVLVPPDECLARS